MASEEKQRNLKLSILDEIKNSNLIHKLRHIPSKRKLNDVVPLKIIISQIENSKSIDESQFNTNIECSQIITNSSDNSNTKCSQANEQDFNNEELYSECEKFYNNTTRISKIPYQELETFFVKYENAKEVNDHDKTFITYEVDKDLVVIKSSGDVIKKFESQDVCKISSSSTIFSNEGSNFERILETEHNLNSKLSSAIATNSNPSVDRNVNDTNQTLLFSCEITNGKTLNKSELENSQSSTDDINHAKILFDEGVEENSALNENLNNNKTCIESNKIPHIDKPSEIEIPSKKIIKENIKSKNLKKSEHKLKPMFVNTLTNEKLIEYELSLQNELKDIQRAENLKNKLREENSKLKNTMDVRSYFDSTSIMPKIDSIRSYNDRDFQQKKQTSKLNCPRSIQKYSSDHSMELHKKRQKIKVGTTDIEYMVKKEDTYATKEDTLDMLSSFNFGSLTSLNDCSIEGSSSSIQNSINKTRKNKLLKLSNTSLSSKLSQENDKITKSKKCLEIEKYNLKLSNANDNLSIYSPSIESSRSRPGYIQNSRQPENDDEILSLLETFFLHHNLQSQSEIEQQIQLQSECDQDFCDNHNLNPDHESSQSLKMRSRGGYCSNSTRCKKNKFKPLRANDCKRNLKSSNRKKNLRPRAGGMKTNINPCSKKLNILSCCDTNQPPPPPTSRKVKITKTVDINLGPGYGVINLLDDGFFETIRTKIVDKILTDLSRLF